MYILELKSKKSISDRRGIVGTRYWWRVVSSNGQVILQSEMYSRGHHARKSLIRFGKEHAFYRYKDWTKPDKPMRTRYSWVKIVMINESALTVMLLDRVIGSIDLRVHPAFTQYHKDATINALHWREIQLGLIRTKKSIEKSLAFRKS